MLKFLLRPFYRSGKNYRVSGSALQLALISSAIFAGGVVYIQNTSDSATQVSNSFMELNTKKTLQEKLYFSTRSSGSITESVKKSNAGLKDCLYDLKKCSIHKGTFPLYSSSGEKISGKYNRFGHNCDLASGDNNFCNSDNDVVLTVGDVEYSIEEVVKNGKKSESYKLFLSYDSKDADNKKIDEMSEGRFEFTGLGGQKGCPDTQYIAGVSEGEVFCEPIAYKGLKGPQGAQGPQKVGARGPRGNYYYHRNNGCFAPETKILLSTGKHKEISNITPRDKVLNPLTGKELEIVKIVKGPEILPMIKLVVADKSIEVTHKHPMVVKDSLSGLKSIVMAKDLKKGDVIQTIVGFKALTEVKKEFKDTGYQVYNLELERGNSVADHLIQADGFITGDLHIQSMVSKENKMAYDTSFGSE